LAPQSPIRTVAHAPSTQPAATRATLTINSRNYGSWSLRGWLMCRFAGVEIVEEMLSSDDPSTRAELLLLSPSFLVPRLTDGAIKVWDTLAIAEYVNEARPEAGLLPTDRAARAHCRAICGEMHSGFSNLRSALPMNIKGRFPGFKVWAGALADISRVTEIWRDCLAAHGGPLLFGRTPGMADAMYAPVCSRFLTYDVALDPVCAAYRDAILSLPAMREWIAAAEAEREEVMELDVEF
jgi:glutathione S-transferase